MILTDGAFHAVDSSELAFRLATIGAFREVYRAANPVILEPIMNVEVVAPVDFQSMIRFIFEMDIFSSFLIPPFPPILGQVIGGINTRRGTIMDSEVRDEEFTAIAEVALNDMFGYSNQLRGSTQGKGEFSMEYKVYIISYSVSLVILRVNPSSLFQHHMPVLPNVQKELEDEYRKTFPAAKK